MHPPHVMTAGRPGGGLVATSNASITQQEELMLELEAPRGGPNCCEIICKNKQKTESIAEGGGAYCLS